jgi:hypothetical protein
MRPIGVYRSSHYEGGKGVETVFSDFKQRSGIGRTSQRTPRKGSTIKLFPMVWNFFRMSLLTSRAYLQAALGNVKKH